MFPIHGLLPKKESKSFEFVRENPEYDGRGTLIAILDTGVDPAAHGMQTTTDGLQKIVDLIDCSGCGDVDMSVTVTMADDDGHVTIKGLSGRPLTIPSPSPKSGSKRWENPSGIYRLGLKNSKDIIPKDAWDRCAKEEGKALEKSALALLSSSPPPPPPPPLLSSIAAPAKELEQDKALQMQVLKDLLLEKSFKPLGSEVMDCILWHDGENWRCIVDSTGKGGDLSHMKPLTNYAIEHEYTLLSLESMANYSINVYDNGHTLSIVSTSGAHGTHVASIAAAYFPDTPELNGVAPGARIVSLKIGDTRFGGLETSQAIIRACTELVRLKVDVCNVSYGEGSVVPSNGPFFDLLKNEVINKSGCVFVTSAGNAGPHLSSVSAPSVVDTAIVVGAYVSHEMQEAYSVMKVKEGAYSWSSLGPSADGDVTVSIYAPGAAITSVSNTTLEKTKLMNGTSMSSPNAAGCIALLLSGLRQKGIKTTPYQIRAALRHCGKDIKDIFQTPLLQIPRTFAYLVSAAGHEASQIHYNLAIGKTRARGVYLRDIFETSNVHEFVAEVTPFFPLHDAAATNIRRIGFEVRVEMRATKSWVSVPSFAVISNGGKNVAFRVDPGGLEAGFHFAAVEAFDVDRHDITAPLFCIPVTVCKPERVDGSLDVIKFDYRLENAQVVRKFLNVPLHANFAEFVFSWKGSQIPGLVQANVTQMIPQARSSGFHQSWNLGMLASGVEEELSVVTKKCPVLGGSGLELCMGNYWSKSESQSISVQVKFHSVIVSASNSSIHAGMGAASANGGELLLNAGVSGFTRFDFSTPLRSESFTPKIKLTSLHQTLFSTQQEVRPLKSRDMLSTGMLVHELLMTFTFSVVSDCEVSFRVPRFSDAIYDSQLESLLGILYDSNKKQLLYFDSYRRKIKLEEGEYTIKLQICSSKVKLLDSIKATQIVIEKNLVKPLSSTLVGLLENVGGDEGAIKVLKMQKGERAVAWMGPLSDLPKDAKAGDLLVGTLDVTSDLSGADLFTVTYIVPAEFKAKPLVPETEGVKEFKEDSVLISEAIREVEVGYLKKLGGDFAKKLAYSKDMQVKYPAHLPFYQEAMTLYRQEWKKAAVKSGDESVTKDFVEIGKARLDTSTKLLDIIDGEEVSKYFGVFHAANTEKNSTLKKEMELKRDLLAASFQAQAEVIQYVIEFNIGPADLLLLEPSARFEQYQVSLEKFTKWIGSSAPQDNTVYVLLTSWHKFQKGLTGAALTMLEKHLSGLKGEKKRDARTECLDLKQSFFEKLGYTVWIEYEKRVKLVDYPKEYCRF